MNLLTERLYAICSDPSPLGNIIELVDKNIINFIWDIPFQTGTEAALFQKILLSQIASIYNNHTSISSLVTDDSIILLVPDDRGPIIKPNIEFVTSKLYSCKNHYKGHLILDMVISPVEVSKFISESKSSFHTLLENINTINLKIL